MLSFQKILTRFHGPHIDWKLPTALRLKEIRGKMSSRHYSISVMAKSDVDSCLKMSHLWQLKSLATLIM